MIECYLRKRLHFSEGLSDLEIDFQLGPGSVLAVYGPSGSGKTSVLRMISGLMPTDEGRLVVDSELWMDSTEGIFLAPGNRNIGMVFQDYALFPQMTVDQNLRYAQATRDESLLINVIEIMELQALRGRKPHMLSGGQQQRVALARALVQKPKLLLLDEPLAALDHDMRSRLQTYILEVRKRFDFPIILVSHDVEEIFRLCDRVIHLVNGKVVNQGPPIEVFGISNKPERLKIEGRLVGIAGENNILQVLIGAKVYQLKVDPSTTRDLKVGEYITLSMEASQLDVVDMAK